MSDAQHTLGGAHTPGPWRLDDSVSEIQTMDGGMVLALRVWGWQRVEDLELMAAAPELLALVEHLNARNLPLTAEMQAQMDAVIAKARGQA